MSGYQPTQHYDSYLLLDILMIQDNSDLKADLVPSHSLTENILTLISLSLQSPDWCFDFPSLYSSHPLYIPRLLHLLF